MRQNINFGKLLHGGDYNPEQWLEYPEILEQDLAYFKKAKINEVSLGIFSWAFLEPEEGVFDLEWLKKMVDRLYENGISVMMATPTAARPRWMAQKYPEVLRMDAMRQRNLYGERHNHCYTSPVYREKTRKINTKLAEAFKDHPGVIAWHISNELGGECHCPLCQEAFRNWVKQKYGSLQALNHAWNTAFWSHTYQSFDQVESPSPKGDASLHGLNLDWKRFVTDQTADFVKWEISALRDAASMQAVAHGSDSVLYFQMRQSRGASEKFHGAVIDHYGGDDTRVFREVTKVGETLAQMQELSGAICSPKVAVIYDTENRWALEDAAGPRNQGLFYKETVEKSYRAFRRLGLDVDVIDETQGLSDYQIVAAPVVYLQREGWVEKVRQFVAGGGTFLATYWSGIVDETDLCFLGGTPHGLLDVMGLRSMEIDGLYDGEWNEGVPVPQNRLHLTRTYRCSNLCELVKPSTAEVLMTYGKDFYAGMPALTENQYGAGKAYQICAGFEQGLYDELCGKLAEEAGVTSVVKEIPDGVEVTTREKNGIRYVFVQNFNRNAVEIKLPVEQYPVWNGQYDGTIGSWETVVLKENSPNFREK